MCVVDVCGSVAPLTVYDDVIFVVFGGGEGEVYWDAFERRGGGSVVPASADASCGCCGG